MLISISGSQGLGKSELIHRLNVEHGVKVIERKTSRSILSDWGVTLSAVNNDRDLTVKFQDEIARRKAADELAASKSSDLYITERSFADLFTYATVAIGKDNEYSKWLDEYYVRCMEYQSMYSHVFYLSQKGRLSTTVENDGVRAINYHYSVLVDLFMHKYTRDMCNSAKVPCTILTSSLAPDRIMDIRVALSVHDGPQLV